MKDKMYILLHQGEVVAMFSSPEDPILLRTIIIKVRNQYPDDYSLEDFYQELEVRRVKFRKYKPNPEMILYF